MFPRSRGLHSSVEGQNIGLEGNAVDNTDDFRHAPRALLNGLHGLDRAGHRVDPRIRRLAHFGGTRICALRCLGVILDR
ncbi:hypothetical protein D3C71_1437160 [compost metagenome]